MSAVVPEFRTRVVTDFRKPVMTQVEASWEDSGGTFRTVPARMENKSVGGVCIRIKTPIVVGSKLKIQWRLEHFFGTVRYCRPEGAEYLVGIQRDSATSPIPNRSSGTDVPPRKSGSSSNPLVSTLKVSTAKGATVEASAVEVSTAKVSTTQTQSPAKRPESQPKAVPAAEKKIEQKTESAPIAPIASSTTTAARGTGHEIDNRDSRRSQPRDLDAAQHLELLQPELPQLELRTEPRTERSPAQAGKDKDDERKHMLTKWLELPWREKQEGLSASGPENGEASTDGNSNGKSEKENVMPQPTPPTLKAPVRSAREVPSFQVDLSTMEDIYRAAGIMNPRKGYSINKVVEMLHSDHIRELSKEMKRAAVLMALDTAGVPIDQVQKDAKARQDALDSHEAEQRKRVEAEWARKADEIIQIKAELESIKAHYTARIGLNMEGVAKEKAIFASWLTLKQQECQSMAEAVEMCLKSPVPEPASARPSDVSMVKASAKTV